MPEPTRIEVAVPFAIKSVNCWYFPGADPALVDCGVNTRASYQALHEGLRAAGATDARLAEVRLFVTHGHVDHAGNAHRLHERHGIELHAPKAETGFIETFRRDSGPRNDEFATALLAHGTPAPIVEAMRADSDAIDAFLDDTPIHHDVADRQRIVLGEMEAESILTPGHTPGSVCFHLSEDNHLLTGDTLLEWISSNPIELRDADRGRYHSYVDQLEMLRKYVGCEALPGHRDPFIIKDDVIDRHMGWHEGRRRRILDALDRPRTAYELMPAIFPKIPLAPEGDLFMALADLVGHLHAAQMDGLVTVNEDSEGVRRFAT